MSCIIKRIKGKYMSHAIEELRDEGYCELARGYYSKVFYHPRNDKEVVKTTVSCDLGWEYTDGWLIFAWRFILVDEAYRSPHIPNVTEITFYDDGYTARMERLSHIDESDYWNAIDTLPIVQEIKGYGRSILDLHQANMMKRQYSDNPEDYCIVITDPYVSGNVNDVNVKSIEYQSNEWSG